MIVGIDTGGTFTDSIFTTKEKVVVHKRLSTPENPARAVIEGWETFVEGKGQAEMTYGTTVATKALSERTEARVVLITTHRDWSSDPA